MDTSSHDNRGPLTKTFLVADLHFNHANILRYDKRPFNSIEHHDSVIVANWNAVVRPGDQVYCLGDFCFGAEVAAERAAQLNGTIHLIEGNHDLKYLQDPAFRDLFASIRGYHEITENGQRIILCHYPILEWNRCHRGAIHCHGHVHGNLAEKFPWYYEHKVFDLGIHLWGYQPVEVREIIRLAAKRKALQHH